MSPYQRICPKCLKRCDPPGEWIEIKRCATCKPLTLAEQLLRAQGQTIGARRPKRPNKLVKGGPVF